MGGFFGGDDEESPPINFTPYEPMDATKINPPINYMRIFDDISGQEFVFKKSPQGERYLQLKNLIQQKKDEYNRGINIPTWYGNATGHDTNLQNEIANLERQAGELEGRAGDTEISIRDLSGRPPIDAPFETVLPEIGDLQNVDLNLPQIQQLIPFEMRYAAAVSDVTNRMRTLNDTITGLEVTDPMAIQRHAPFIQAFKDANRRAMERGFDIRYNGIDNKLREMGLNNSTTALGAILTLQKQKTDTEIENNFKEYAFANQLKQESINNLIKSGSTLAQEGDSAFKMFAQDSGNQLQIRQQDLATSDLEQQRGRAIQAAQLQMRQQQLGLDALKLEKGGIERKSELAKRELTLNQQLARDPSKMGLNFIANNNTNAVNAVGVTNTGLFNKQQGELKASELEQERFRLNQMAQSDPFGNLLNTAVGTLAGSFAGGLGTSLGYSAGGVDLNKTGLLKK